jgi:hypothetical protein
MRVAANCSLLHGSDSFKGEFVRKVSNDGVDYIEKNLSFFDFRHLSSYLSVVLKSIVGP